MFYTFYQNNSGGFRVEDDRLARWVIIEADNAYEANKKARDISIYFDPDCLTDCECCGPRWKEAEEWDASDLPKIFDEVPSSKDDYITYFLDGKIERRNKI